MDYFSEAQAASWRKYDIYWLIFLLYADECAIG